MSLEWKSCKIGDVVSVRRGASPRPIKDYISEKGMPWVKIADATKDQTRFINFTSEFIKEGGIEKSVVVNPGDLIVSNSATPGLPKFMNIKACVHDGWLVFDNYDGILKDFLYYYFIVIRGRLVNQANGSVFKNLKTDIVKDFNINLPDMETQEKIANILSQIDKKIELNININKNLDDILDSIFKENFIKEFDNDNNDWKIKNIGELPLIITDYVANGSFASLKENVTILDYEEYAYFIRNTDLKSKSFQKFVNKHSYDFLKKSSLFGNEVIISNVGDVGSVFLCPFLDKPMTLGNNMILVKSRDDAINLNFYLFLLFRSNYGQYLISTITAGSVQSKFNKTEFKSLELTMPNDELIIKFNNLVSPIFDYKNKISDEIVRLTKLRDTLLPKLMSGEIDVSKINCDLELICKLTLFTHKYPNQLCKHKLIHLNLKSLRKSKNTAFKVDFGQFLFYN